MKILAVESSAKSASVCIFEDGKLIAENFQNCGHTHSKTLLPMIENIFESTGYSLSDINLLAVALGPGSFTGIRIGISVIKGLAFGCDLPCLGASTLEAMAYNYPQENHIICPVMDARGNQVYNALFTFDNGILTRLCDDRAISIACLKDELCTFDKPVLLVGDGAEICFNAFADSTFDFKLSPPHLLYQRAYGVALACYEKQKQGILPYSHHNLTPEYLRLPQAERERLSK